MSVYFNRVVFLSDLIIIKKICKNDVAFILIFSLSKITIKNHNEVYHLVNV